jgi:hypothetical protein
MGKQGLQDFDEEIWRTSTWRNKERMNTKIDIYSILVSITLF